MKSEPDAMPFDAEVLRNLIDENKLTAKRLAMLSGRDLSTIYRYLQGDKTTPSDVLRAAFEETHDGRILGLVTGRVPVNPVILITEIESNRPGQTPARIPPIGQCMDRTIDAIKAAAAGAEHMAHIIADGKFDQADLQQAAEYERDAHAAIEALSLSLAAIAAHKGRLQS